MVIHSGKTQAQVARELGVSDYSLILWKKAYLKQQSPAQIDGEQQSPEQMAKTIRQLHKEVEYLKRRFAFGQKIWQTIFFQLASELQNIPEAAPKASPSFSVSEELAR